LSTCGPPPLLVSMAEPRYGGVFAPKASPDDIEAASHAKPPTHTWKSGETAHAHGSAPSVKEATSKAARLWEPAEEAKHEGAYVAKNPGSVDMKDVIDKMCHKNCHAAWEEYEKCEARIEKKGGGTCTGWYMDYFHCIDQCSTKTLFKTLA